MICPKCDSEMNEIDAESFSALKCSGCAGIWFRDGSHELAKSIQGAGKIDSDSTQAGAAHNDNRDIDCPECQQKMMKMIDRDQFHIEFEACADCDAVFFDAGEFRDLTEFTFMERVKQTIETLKSNLNS